MSHEQVKRYNPGVSYVDKYSDETEVVMDECTEGHYVKYEDYLELKEDFLKVMRVETERSWERVRQTEELRRLTEITATGWK